MFEVVFEKIVEHDEIKKLRRVLIVRVADVLDEDVRDILHGLCVIVPNAIEQLKVRTRSRCIETIDERIARGAAFATELRRREAVHRQINARVRFFRILDDEIARASILFRKRPELYLLPNPVRAFARNRPLRHLVAELQLEFRTVEAFLTREARDVELALFLRRALLEERWRREEKAQAVNLREFFLQCIKRINGKARRRHRQPAAFPDRLLQIVPDEMRDIIK